MSSSRVLHSQIISAIIHCSEVFDKAIRVLLTESLSLILFPFIAIKLLLSPKIPVVASDIPASFCVLSGFPIVLIGKTGQRII